MATLRNLRRKLMELTHAPRGTLRALGKMDFASQPWAVILIPANPANNPN